MAERTIRTHVLTERVPAECRLSADDVAFLLDHHRAHVRLVPGGRRGRYQLTALGHVGTIVCPGCRLVIRPKIPLPNLFHLLDPTAPVPVTEDLVAPETGDAAFDFLAGRLARLLTERATAGLHRAYAERVESGPFLHGRLDLPAQLRDPNTRGNRLHCRYEEFTADVLCNQVPKATADLLLRSPLIGDGVRAALLRCLPAFDDVRAIALDHSTFETAAPDRLTQAYRPLLDLCRLLFDALAPGEASGAIPGLAFLLDMERVFERYVSAGIARSFADSVQHTVALQPSFVATRPLPEQPNLYMRPDIVIQLDGRPTAVLDVKWKKGAGLSSDVYQVLAYCTALGVQRAVLVYPGRHDRLWKYELAQAPVIVEMRTLRVVGSRAPCARSLDRLGRAVRNATS